MIGLVYRPYSVVSASETRYDVSRLGHTSSICYMYGVYLDTCVIFFLAFYIHGSFLFLALHSSFLFLALHGSFLFLAADCHHCQPPGFQHPHTILHQQEPECAVCCSSGLCSSLAGVLHHPRIWVWVSTVHVVYV